MRPGILCVAFICAVTFAGPAIPAPARAPAGGLAERYDHARHALEENRAAEAKTEAERNRLQREAEDLRARLIAIAARVQSLEQERAQAETDLVPLKAQAIELEAGFVHDREKVGHLLAVLQRLDRDEPPALALRPTDSLAAARGAMLLGAMLPPVYARAAELAGRLQSLRTTSAALEKKSAEARTTTIALGKARIELAALLDKRNAEAEAAQSHLTELHSVTEEAARETGDLKSLMDRIAGLRAQSGGATGMTIVTAESTAPTPIRRGTLRRPVLGPMAPGGPDAPGPVTAKGAEISGLWFTAEGGAPAVAPADSAVVFAGPYQKFGQVLILEIAGGYDLLLAGLGRIDVRIGDSVLAGEPVGILSRGAEAHLYMELRRGGQTVNPAPWLAAESRKAKGT